jgi:hypothetical protein
MDDLIKSTHISFVKFNIWPANSGKENDMPCYNRITISLAIRLFAHKD